MLDGLSMLIIGGYLAAVIYRGNLPQLLHLLGGEIAFAEWAVAVAALTVVYRNPSTHAVGRGLILLALALVALYLVYHFLRHPVATGDPREEMPVIGPQLATKLPSPSGPQLEPSHDHKKDMGANHSESAESEKTRAR